MEALCQLDLRHRQVLVEVYYRGHSVTEAAARLGVPPETVKVRTYYALRRLRLLLEEGGSVPAVSDDEVATVRGDVPVLGGGES